MKSFITVAAAIITLVLITNKPVLASTSVAKALNQAPENAQVVLIIPSIQQLNNDLSRLGKAWGIKSTSLNNVLGLVKQKAGIKKGLDDQGTLLVIIPDVTKAFANPDQPEIALLVPVNSYSAFISNFNKQKSRGAVTRLTFADTKDTTYSRHLGAYALLSPSKSLAANYKAAHQAAALIKKAGRAGKKNLSSADIALYVDLQAMAPTAIARIDKALAEIKGDIKKRKSLPGHTSKDKQMIQIFGRAIKAVLQQGIAMVSAIHLGPSGVSMTDTLRFKPDSKLASLFPGSSGQLTGQLLDKLPDAGYLMVSAYDYNAIKIGKLIKLVVNHLPKNSSIKPFLKVIKKQSLPM